MGFVISRTSQVLFGSGLSGLDKKFRGDFISIAVNFYPFVLLFVCPFNASLINYNITFFLKFQPLIKTRIWKKRLPEKKNRSWCEKTFLSQGKTIPGQEKIVSGREKSFLAGKNRFWQGKIIPGKGKTISGEEKSFPAWKKSFLAGKNHSRQRKNHSRTRKNRSRPGKNHSRQGKNHSRTGENRFRRGKIIPGREKSFLAVYHDAWSLTRRRMKIMLSIS
ncbi:MAG: hypothetical protein JSV88_26230 [Candidatus Aminicenantes bacterium]|nr:MAG: hypothetical protein JSV88_26230 [Candidatus Aminicenantes bacterium]